ncbi:MAG: hypothetical protein ACNA8W_25820, partial [Bradymonadaceae bacterium]
MFLRNKRLTAIVALVSMTQLACYNTYFITTSELSKLESDVEPREVVEIFGDCPQGTTAYRSVLDGSMWAEATGDEAGVEAGADEPAVATDAASGVAAEATPPGCTRVPVSTANAVNVLTSDGYTHRVTPFNFVMSDSQLVSPEYDLLLNISEVQGAQVKEFSTWKTVAMITGMSVLAIGTFVGISVVAP